MKYKFSGSQLCLVLLLCMSDVFSQTIPKKIALIIGVKSYQFVPPLQNSLNDARDISAALKSKDFQVIELYDPKNKREMQDAIRKYFSLLQGQKDVTGLVFYSGHGMQVGGSNYFIPTQADPQIEADLEDQCLNMDYVMRAIEQAGNPLNIFIIDACRNNPFRSFSRSAEKGLSMVNTPKGSYIVYATKPGAVASDGVGRNGLFTSKLLKHLNVGGLNIEQVFKRVAADVAVESNDAQRPWIASDYTGDFFFTPVKETELSVVNAQTQKTPTANANLFESSTTRQLYSGGKKLFDNKLYTEAFTWFEKAAGQGDAKSQNRLGIIYEFGDGVAKNDTEAVKWYRKAADQGDALGQYNLGVMYESGSGVPKDEAEAIKWFKKAAEQGNTLAQNNLGSMYESGRGVSKDLNEAAKWYDLSVRTKNISQQILIRQSEIKLKLVKLKSLGTVLYVGAHPDDENTRALTYFANERLFTTGYLSLTRGESGQNLIGPEDRDLLGVIRTQEALASRSIDGAQQFFTLANDFGFSKSTNETVSIWSKETTLSDVVRVIRKFQPDVVITRFPADERAGHGHHSTSATITQEAFDLANDPRIFPEQLQLLDTWQPKRLYFNTARFWNPSISENTPGVISIDMGGYNSMLEKSNSEIATLSRGIQKSQSFGSQARRGEAVEYFEYVKGEKSEKDLFDGINTTWSRVKGGDVVLPLIEAALLNFEEDKPWAIMPQLISIRKAIRSLEDCLWKQRKLDELDIIIKDCLGLTVDASASTAQAVPGQKISVSFEVINRSPVEISFTKISSSQLKIDSIINKELKYNKPVLFKTSKTIPKDLNFSMPFWLRKEHSEAGFIVDDPNLIGLAQDVSPISFRFSIAVLGETITVNDQLDFRTIDPVKGESYRPVEITPPVFLNLNKPTYVFANQLHKEVSVLIRSAVTSSIDGVVQLKVPPGWRVEPSSVPFKILKYNNEQKVTFQIYPIDSEQEGTLQAVAIVNGNEYDLSINEIAYDHIPIQAVMSKAKSKLVRLNLQKHGKLVAYLNGAEDRVPEALRNMGYDVWEMKEEEVTSVNLKKVDAVVLGIRLLNTSSQIKSYIPTLLEYVNDGGVLVTQYNNSFNLGLEVFSPYPIKLSRDRVSEEKSEVRILKPNHWALNYPNKITEKDFQGWVVERGLYFPDKWDPKYEALLSMNDSNENPKDGGLLVAKYGRGHYIYTSLAFFRELPEGVTGAYKLFANLVSAGKTGD